jgi:hypothetical protein
MDAVTAIMFSFHGLIWGGGFIILIVLVVKRLDAKKRENLDEYDN